jgi:hypothetical protein
VITAIETTTEPMALPPAAFIDGRPFDADDIPGYLAGFAAASPGASAVATE